MTSQEMIDALVAFDAKWSQAPRCAEMLHDLMPVLLEMHARVRDCTDEIATLRQRTQDMTLARLLVEEQTAALVRLSRWYPLCVQVDEQEETL